VIVPIDLGNPIEMSVNEFADIVAELLGDTGREYRELPESDPVRRRPDILRATNLLGWTPTTSLDDGLRRTWDYLTALDR
jgi:nucleoside-diphosphate-sugar epimerase